MTNSTQSQSNPPTSDVADPSHSVEAQPPLSTIPTYQSPNLTPPVSQKRPSFVLPLVLALIFLFLTAVFGAGSYAVAYQKIKLPEKFQPLQVAVTNFVQSLPFTPKTPEFLIAKALIAQEKVNKESYDISIAVDSQGGAIIPGLESTFDIAAKGLIDYSDTKNVRFTSDAFVTKDFNFELAKPDHLLYFKINKIPSLLLSFTGMTPEDLSPVLNRWYSYDTTPLSTEARAEIEKKEDREVFSDKFVNDTLDDYIDEKLVKAMKVSNDNVDNFAVYKISIVADQALIDHIGQLIDEAEKRDTGAKMDTARRSEKLSDIVKSMTWEVNIDKKEYYVRKVAITAEVEVDEVDSYSSLFLGSSDLTSTGTSANIAIAAKFSDFGKEVVIEKPDGAKSWEEFTDQISGIVSSQYSRAYPPPTPTLPAE